MYEAAYHGIPIIGMAAAYADQRENVAKAVQKVWLPTHRLPLHLTQPFKDVAAWFCACIDAQSCDQLGSRKGAYYPAVVP